MSKSILESVHEDAKVLHEAGLIKDLTMREFDALCLPCIQEFSAMQIKSIRLKNKASQGVFANYLNISKSTVQKWEQGLIKPNGSALKLLNMVADKGLEVLS